MDLTQIIGLVLGYGIGIFAFLTIVKQMRSVEAQEKFTELAPMESTMERSPSKAA